MKSQILAIATLSLGLLCCAEKPKIAAKPEPISSPTLATNSQPQKQNSASSTEDSRMKIKELLDEAFKPIYFPFDQATLSNTSKNLLAEAGNLMKQDPSVSVLVQGNTDERGTEEYNLALGEKRAHTAMDYLVAYGIDPSRIKIISYGKEKPAVPGHDEVTWAKNRRDEFNVTL